MKPQHRTVAAPLLAAVIAAALASGAHADTVYKWVDANGTTNYTTAPPAAARKVSTVNAVPAVASTYVPVPGMDESRYWTERRQRESADALRSAQLAAEKERLENDRLRQQIAYEYDEDQRRAAAAARAQAAFDQCMFDRMLTCNPNGTSAGATGGVIVIGRSAQPITAAAPFPVPGSLLVTNATPGAPSLHTYNPTPGAFTLNRAPAAVAHHGATSPATH